MKNLTFNSENREEIQWWKPVKEAFTGVNLKGLKAKCPKCEETGLITTRWVKGESLKPIFVLHIKRGKVRKVCEPNEKQSNDLRSKVSIFRSDVKNLLEARKPFVLFSGGKDSLATLVYLNDIVKEIDKDLTAIYVDTTAGLPENTRYVKRVCRYLGITLKVVRPKVDYFTMAKEWGIPSFRYRWCCRELKIKPIAEYLNKIKEPKVIFDGIRAAESNIRRQYIPIWYHPTFKCLSASPIFHWSDGRVISLINNNGLPKTLLHSLLNTSTECWCGAYKTESDFKKLYGLNKYIFNKLSKLEEESKSGYTFLYKSGKRVPLRELERKILNSEEGN